LALVEDFHALTLNAIIYFIFYVIGFRMMRTYSGIFRYSSFVDLLRVSYAMVFGTLIAYLLHYILASHDLFSHFRGREIVVASIMGTFLMWFVRMFVKTVYDVSYANVKAKRTFIYGVKDGGVGIAKQIRNEKPTRFQLKGFITDTLDSKEYILMGVKVHHLDEKLVEVMKEERVEAMIISPFRLKAFRNNSKFQNALIDAGILEMDPDQQGDNVFTTDAYLAGQYEGYVKKELADLNPNSEGVRKVNMSDGILYPKFRLPTEAEWEYASLGLIGNTTKEGRILERRIYPWNGHVVRTDQKKYYGEMLANFKRSRGDAMGVASALNDHWEYTAPVDYYFPNDYGLYNMAGNVAEWVMDVYRPNTPEDAGDINPYRGNVYITKVLDSDGMIAEKDSLGRITYREVTVEDNINRRNYRQSDNINYLDGDLASQIVAGNDWKSSVGEEGEEEEEVTTTEEEEEEVLNKESETNGMYEYGKTSMINDKVRVVKGGSWKDKALYLSPGEKRFLAQDQKTEWIGFRCAMDRMGSREMKR